VFETLVIQSHKGQYAVFFEEEVLPENTHFPEGESHFLIDSKVARFYESNLKPILEHPNTILIEANENSKSIENIIPIFERLVRDKVRRGHVLIAIGGGIIQDITCFIASVLLRGLLWKFIPTTLLAQADSCIGSKSSINLGSTKNILGTFNPPEKIFICPKFLETLDSHVIRSGIGEIIKVHAIEGVSKFDQLAKDYDLLFSDQIVMQKYIRSALLIKRKFIEEDEFDRGIRNIFNYGHSFGHAIESTTNYLIPHGIAVTIGMDMANYISVKRGLLPVEHHRRMHPVLLRNYEKYADIPISVDLMLSELRKDKKNSNTMLGLIFPVGRGATIQKIQVSQDETFRRQCQQFFDELNRK